VSKNAICSSFFLVGTTFVVLSVWWARGGGNG
jgi:hypothetical protein